jgi:hypothetical protein
MGGVTYESLHKVATFFFRYFPQMLIIYLSIFAFARMVAPRQKSENFQHSPLLQRSY